MAIKQALAAAFRELRGNSLNNPSVPLSAAGFLAWVMGSEPTASGEQVTLNTALQQISVYSCTRVLAESVASLPPYVYEMTAQGRNVASDHPLGHMLRWEPNDEMSGFTLWECLVGSMALTGNGYVQIERDRGGRPKALWPLHPQLTEPKRSGSGALIYETTDGEPDGKTRILSADDMIHVPLFSFNGLKGLSPIHMARQGIGLARASEKFGARFFGNGARPAGVLSSAAPLSPQQAQQMRDTWNQTQGGEAQGSIAVLPGSWTYAQIGLSPEDSQFLKTREMQRSEIASLFRVPPHMIGDTTRLSNNNHEQMNLSFVTDSLRPYLARIEAELVRKLLPKVGRNAGRFTIEFDVRERLRGDFKTMMDGFGVGKQWGFLSTNDVRKELDMNPIGAEGDVYWVPVNMQDSARLLDTESIQDQPLGAGPNAAGEPDTESGEEKQPPKPAEGDRNLLGSYTRGYIAIFRDAFARLWKRETRDSEAISKLIGPVLQSIAAAAGDDLPSTDAAWSGPVREALGAMERRAPKWPPGGETAELEALAQSEFLKAVRSIHINVHRDRAAAQAIRQLEGQA